MGQGLRATAVRSDGVETDPTGDDRDRTARDRDERADVHDEASQARDDRADARDQRAEVRERAASGSHGAAADDRLEAQRDRRGGAGDRIQAAEDREAAAVDRILSARERAASTIDELTGAYRRDPGVVALDRDISTAKRTDKPLTVAFVDIDNLKGTNDALGHSAGDRLLRVTAASIRAHIRAYDLIIRFGGDEFLCALLDVNEGEAAERFSLANLHLATTHQASITVGLTELDPADALEDLVRRADEAMYEQRR